MIKIKKISEIEMKWFMAGSIFIAYIILSIIGLTGIASASFGFSLNKSARVFYYLYQQLFHVSVGFAVIVFAQLKLVRYSWLKSSFVQGSLYVLTSIILILTPMVGRNINGATRWLFGVQPSEFAKIIFIILAAKWFADLETKDLNNINIIKKKLIKLGVIVAIPGLILFQRDLGTVVHFAMIFIAFMVVSKIPKIVTTTIIGFCITIVYMLISSTSFRGARVSEYLDGLKETGIGGGYQVSQAIIGLGNGGFFGVGYGNGIRKYKWLPEVHTDFIFSSIGEELGFIILIFIIFLYVLILVMGIGASINLKDGFAKYAVYGITMLISTQVIMNLLVATGLMPVTGIPLAFVSYGGSSYISLSVGLAILLNIIKNSPFVGSDEEIIKKEEGSV